MNTNMRSERTKSAYAEEMKPDRIGHRLKLLRVALGFQPAEMADFLEIERTYWSRSEGGKRAASKELAALLVERCNVTMDFILLGKWSGLPLDLATKMRKIDSQDPPK